MRRLSRTEWTLCAVAGGLLGLLARPQLARVPGAPADPWEVGMAVGVVVGGGLALTAGYWLLVWRKGW